MTRRLTSKFHLHLNGSSSFPGVASAKAAVNRKSMMLVETTTKIGGIISFASAGSPPTKLHTVARRRKASVPSSKLCKLLDLVSTTHTQDLGDFFVIISRKSGFYDEACHTLFSTRTTHSFDHQQDSSQKLIFPTKNIKKDFHPKPDFCTSEVLLK